MVRINFRKKNIFLWVGLGVAVFAVVVSAVFYFMFGRSKTPSLEKEGYVLDWHDEFDGDELDFTKWLPQYLPHATTSSSGFMADYEVSNGSLKLNIDENRPTFYEQDSQQGFKVCGIQSYNKNGLHEKTAIGSNVVPYKGYTTQYGYFETRYKVPSCDGGGHVAFWMIGTQADAREDGTCSLQTGEIDITETNFSAPNLHAPKVYCWTDEDLKDWSKKVPIDDDYVNEYHTFALDWTPDHLAFFVDGKEIARTNQSPQYEMCMILSMYINDDPESEYWSGISNDVFPKTWEIDYVRVYKDKNGYPDGVTKPTDPVVLPGEEGAIAIKSEILIDPNAPLNYIDVASSAKLTFSDEPALNSRPEAVNSTNPVCGDGYASTSNPKFPQEFIFNWDTPQTVDTMRMFVHYALGQAPNIVEIQTLKEGGNWEKAANYTIKWKTEMETIEYSTMEFKNGEDIIGLKLIVHNANLIWDMYVINKIHIYNSQEAMSDVIDVQSKIMTKAPTVGNIAPFALLTYSHGHTENSRPETVNDTEIPGEDGFASIPGDSLPQMLTFEWKTMQNVDTLDLYVNYAKAQAPSFVELKYRKPGGSWQSSGLYHINWQEESEKMEYARLAVPNGDGITELKLIVKAANMMWGNFVINKVQIYKKGVPAPDPNAPIGTPTKVLTKAPEGLKNLAPDATVTVSDAMQNARREDDAANNLSRINDKIISDDSYARYADGTQCKDDWIQFKWNKPISLQDVVLYCQYSGQAPTAWEIYVSSDEKNWNRVVYTGNVKWSAEVLEGRALSFEKQENISALRIKITDANVDWGHYCIYEVEIYGRDNKIQTWSDFKKPPEGTKNLALSAVVSAKVNATLDNSVKQINDGDRTWAVSRPATTLNDETDYYYLYWKKPVNIQQVVLFNQYSGQAPTNWKIAVTADGINWKEIAFAEDVTWSEEELEGKALTFAAQENIIGLRLQIEKANLDWGHYCIYELEVYGTDNVIPTWSDFIEPPEDTKNIALKAKASADINAVLSNSVAQINDGDREWSISRPATTLNDETDYYYLYWKKPVNIQQVVLFNQYSGQAPTKWIVAITKDGEDWEEIAVAEDVTWSEEQLEGKALTFDEQEDIIGIRLQIVEANLDWEHYCIYEIEVYGTDNNPLPIWINFTEPIEGTKNIAPSAKASAQVNATLDNSVKQLNDGDRTWAVSRPATTLNDETDYYYLYWKKPVNIQQVVLFNQYSGQAPTKWIVAITKDGEDWEEIAVAEDVTWSEEQLEGKALTFDEQEDVIGIRLQIVEANLDWEHYCIYEVEVYGTEKISYVLSDFTENSENVKNLALSAEASAEVNAVLTNSVKQINEGDRSWALSRPATSLNGENDYYYLRWNEPVNIRQVVLFNQYSGQAPTKWIVAITKDGEAWEEIAVAENVIWSEDKLEGKALTFDEQEDIIGIRLQIIKANLVWGHYCVYEIEVYGTEDIAKENLALSATVTASDEAITNGADIARINDNDITWSMARNASSLDSTTDYYQFTWQTPVSVEQVALFNQYSGQAPTAWKVFVTSNGENWEDVASINDVVWTEDKLECKNLKFAKQDNIIGLRVQIEDANLIWGHYCIYEVKIY